MCQSRVEADFCFPYAKDGQLSSFMDYDVNEMAQELSIAEVTGFRDAALSIAEIRREGRRSVLRLFWYIVSAEIILRSISFYLKTAVGDFGGKNKAAAVIITYLHRQDGKKRFSL